MLPEFHGEILYHFVLSCPGCEPVEVMYANLTLDRNCFGY